VDKIIELTNQMWFSVVCALIDNDMRHLILFILSVPY